MARRSSNRVLVPEAKQALDSFKYEIASELGMNNYANIDKGQLTARQNGYVGGNMVKRMIAQAQSSMAGGTNAGLTSSSVELSTGTGLTSSLGTTTGSMTSTLGTTTGNE